MQHKFSDNELIFLSIPFSEKISVLHTAKAKEDNKELECLESSISHASQKVDDDIGI